MMKLSFIEKKSKKTKLFMITLLIGVLVLLLDFTPLGGNWRMYANWIRCGSRPVGTNLEWQIGGGSVPTYGSPSLIGVMRGSEYYCTPLEAEKAGYSASPYQYQFPNLEKERAGSEE